MAVIFQTKGDKTGIHAEVISSKSPATEEWDSECRIYNGEQEIGYLSEGDEDISIRGSFDFRETGEVHETIHENDIPVLVDDAFCLSIDDLITLKKIIEYWISDCEEHEEMWEKVIP